MPVDELIGPLGKIDYVTSRHQLNRVLNDLTKVVEGTRHQRQSTRHVNQRLYEVIMLRRATAAFADRHPDPFESLTPEQRQLYDRNVREFDALRSANRGLISEQPAAADEAERPSADVPRKEEQAAVISVEELLTRIEAEVFSMEPDPFHRRVTSLLKRSLRRDEKEVRWVTQILERSKTTTTPHRYFCKCIWNRYGGQPGSC